MRVEGLPIPRHAEPATVRARLWCFGALYSTHIVAPRTPNSYAVIRDKLGMSSPVHPKRGRRLEFTGQGLGLGSRLQRVLGIGLEAFGFRRWGAAGVRWGVGFKASLSAVIFSRWSCSWVNFLRRSMVRQMVSWACKSGISRIAKVKATNLCHSSSPASSCFPIFFVPRHGEVVSLSSAIVRAFAVIVVPL